MEGSQSLLPSQINLIFLPGTSDVAFRCWTARGIVSLGDLFVDSTLMTIKILHRAHAAPNRFSKYRKDVSPVCLKCKTEIIDLTHCYWSCAKVQKYWNDILTKIQKEMKRKLGLGSVSLLLGLLNDCVTDLKRLYNVLTFFAQRNILTHWITDKAPSLGSTGQS